MLYGWWLKLYSAAADLLTRGAALLIYFLVLTPAAFAWRLFKGDALRLGRPASGSTFLARPRKFSAADLERPW